MKLTALLFFCFPLLMAIQTTGKSDLKKNLQELESFMSNHIPDGHSSVEGYELSIEGTVLTKKTVLMDGDSHSTTFELKNAHFTYDRETMSEQDAEFFGYDEYWNVYIDGSWLHSELLKESYARTIIGLLQDIQTELDK